MPASADAVSASCHVKPSKARRALAYPAPSAGAARAALCAANLTTF